MLKLKLPPELPNKLVLKLKLLPELLNKPELKLKKQELKLKLLPELPLKPELKPKLLPELLRLPELKPKLPPELLNKLPLLPKLLYKKPKANSLKLKNTLKQSRTQWVTVPAGGSNENSTNNANTFLLPKEELPKTKFITQTSRDNIVIILV